VPVRVADIKQRRPASNLVEDDRSCRVDGEPLAHLLEVAEDRGGLQAVAGDVGGSVENGDGLAHTALDRRRYERPGQSFGSGGTGLNGRLELRPTGEAQLAGDDQLGGSERDRSFGCAGVSAGEALDGAGVAAPGSVAQLLGLAAQLVEVGALGKRSGHSVSLLTPAVRCSG
jgi:hypothetical protein